MSRWLLWAPLALFALLMGVVASGLFKPSDHIIQSRMIGKPLPPVMLPPAVPGREGIASANYRSGKPRLLNIFASWCIPCIAEAPVLMQLKQRGVPIDAVAIRDTPADVAKFLRDNGDPYARIGSDVDSSLQFALGSSGVPETFVIDGRGIVRHQHIGAIRADDVPEMLAALEAAR